MGSQRCENSLRSLPNSPFSFAPATPRSEQCVTQGLSLAYVLQQNGSVSATPHKINASERLIERLTLELSGCRRGHYDLSAG